MPIRFRCAYCNQLLGISRRKAGGVVRCPSCAGQVVVPTLEEIGMEKEEAAAVPGAPPSPLFEGNELDKLLEGVAGDQPNALPNAGPSRPVVNPLPAPTPEPASGLVPPPGFPTLSAGSSGRPVGIFLSPARATLLSVLAVVALAIAFAAGLMVGLFLQPGR